MAKEKEAPTWDPNEYLVDVKKGDKVRLLQPINDGVQSFAEGSEVFWPHDTPPHRTVAAHVGDRSPTPLDAPPMGRGKPASDKIDPATGKPYVVPVTGQS